MLLRYTISILILLFGLQADITSQSSNCNSVTAPDSSSYEGTAFFNYGSWSKSFSQKYSTSIAFGQNLTGYIQSAKYNSTVGFYSRYLLPPFALKVTATQGDLLDRIQLVWEIDALGPSPNEGFNIYRDSIFLATVGPNIRNYNDFNVIAGVAYTYTVRGLNGYGEGSPSDALGFQVPNGVVTGWVQTRSGNAVPNALVTLMPMQGFSAKFGAMDGASAAKDTANAFMPTSGDDWTMTFWLKTNTSTANGSILQLDPIPFYIKALPSTSGDEGIEIATSSTGGTILSAAFPDSTSNGWHHVALSWNNGVSRLYIDGVLSNQANVATIGVVDTLLMGAKAGLGGWDGYLDEFRIYDRQLDELDLLEVMEGTASSLTPGLSHYWKMDEELGEKSYDLKKRHKLFFCGARFDIERPPVRTAGLTNEDGYYRIESASYGTGTTFLAQPMKSFYLHKSIKFSPSEMSYATLPNFGMTKKSTIETWINTTGSTSPQTILHKKWGTNECQIFLNPVGLTSELKVKLNGATNTFGIVPPDFQHLAFTIDSLTGTVKGYLNGAFLASHTYGAINGSWADSLQTWNVGAKKDGNTLSEYFSGLIDEVAVYDTTLAVAKILTHATSARNMRESGLRQYFPMDEGSGTRLSNVGSVLLEPGTMYNASWSSFAPNQETDPHVFSPKTRQVTLNPSVTSVDQVDFIDQSTVAVSGFVRYVNTDCFANKVEILVNGASFSPQIFTDSLGEFVIDFDPGTTAMLTPKLEDHVFVPAFWEITNVTSPRAGILFNDMTTRTISGKVVGGSGICEKSVIKAPAGNAQNQGTVCIVEVRAVNGCLVRALIIDNQEGDYEFTDLPPLEKMTVAVIEHSNDMIKTAFQVQGGSTVNLVKNDTTINFKYIAPPEVEISNGLTPIPGCSPEIIVIEKDDDVTIDIKVKETYISTPTDDGVCYLDTANIQIINGMSDNRIDTTMSNGNLQYTFRVGNPNPSPPYLKTLQVIGTSIPAGRIGSTVKQAIVTGTLNKLQTFTTMMPFMPSVILRDPPGDGSSSFLEKTEKVCKTTELTMDKEFGISGSVDIEVVPTLQFVVAPFGLGKIITVDPDLQINLESQVTYSKVSSNSFQTCVTFNNRIATSDAELIVGGERGGDLYVGEAINIIFGFADVVTFDTCTVSVDQILEVEPGNFASTFVYSENNIKSNVLRYLNDLAGSPGVDSTNRANYLESIDRWNAIIARNDTLKKSAEFIRNLSFDAGVEYQYSETADTTDNSSVNNSLNTDSKVGTTFGFSGDNIGTKFKINALVKTSDGKRTENGVEKGLTTGYTLKDNDPGDAFTVDVAMDSVYKTPVFRLRAGQSSCPWEPGTANREAPNLELDEGSQFTAVNVPAQDPAVFNMRLGNLSATNEDWVYGFTAISGSNPDGAVIKLNGQVLNGKTVQYLVPYNTSIPITLTVERGPVAYEYAGLKVALVSECELARDLALSLQSDEKFFSSIDLGVDFIRPCSEVKINVPEQNWAVINNDPLQPGTLRRITVSGYDINSPDFQLIRLQYRRSDGNGTWINLPTPNGIYEAYNPRWTGFQSLPNDPDTLLLQPDFTQFMWDTDMIADGEYEIHAWAVCSGDASDKPGFSDIIRGKIDRQPPSIVGVPQPSDGVYQVGDEISFTFNQEINCNRVLEVANVELINTETNLPLDIVVSCVGNKIVIESNFPNEDFENKILRSELHNIQDLTGNIMTEAHWEFYVDRNELAWLTDSISVTKYTDETKTIRAKIHNRGGYPVPYTITAPDWVRVSPDRGTMVANEVEEISFTVDALMPLGEFSDSIIMHTETGINPFFMGGDEVLIMDARVICRPEKWVINPNGFNGDDYEYSMNFTLELNIEGDSSTDVEDIVGAYVGAELRGVAKVNYYAELNKHLAFLTVFSDTAVGETVNFQIWDASECKLYATTVESFPYLADTVIGKPDIAQVIHTNGDLLRKIYINPGWNWISFNLDLVDPAINGALSSLTNPQSVDVIKNQTDISSYSTVAQIWAGNVDSIDFKPMYQHFSTYADSISMIGVNVDPETPITLDTGWNWIGYLPHQGLPINDALGSLSPLSGDIIKSQITFSQYVDNLGWIGNLSYLNPPNGYLIYLANAGTLSYPDPLDFNRNSSLVQRAPQLPSNGQTIVATTPASQMPFQHWTVDPNKYEHNMNVISIVVNQDGAPNLLGDGDEVGIFVDNEVRGSGKALYIPAFNAYMVFATVYANKNGETLTFKYYDASENAELAIIDKSTFKINAIMGNVDAPLPLRLMGTSGVNDDQLSANARLYPNPFIHQLNIDFETQRSGDVKISIVDVLGNLVFEKLVEATSGHNTLEWKPKADITRGTYFVKIQGDDISHYQKVLYLR